MESLMTQCDLRDLILNKIAKIKNKIYTGLKSMVQEMKIYQFQK